ncbi:MAG: Citrate transporter [Bacteroidota bacterium]|jgi:Na+/H+ antiporter NhaD/arsenite permease-like protein|nr:Citrate transporter [Bacteroidota bacterium]
MNFVLISVFIAGYLLIAFESTVKINKAASALLTGAICWAVYSLVGPEHEFVNDQLSEHLSGIAGILFFLMGAMTIVEIIDAHDGFDVITSMITTRSKKKLLYTLCILAFFLSAILDNLTTTIVMISLLRKLTEDRNERLLFSGMIVIAANAGGAWSPIGDVTTTMLWIGGQITATNIIYKLFIPSLLCLFVPLLIMSLRMKGKMKEIFSMKESKNRTTLFERRLVLVIGLASLIFVPVFKTWTHLPPFMGVLAGLGVLWAVTEILHLNKEKEDKGALSVANALQKIDVPSILFFLGILIAISSLESTGILSSFARLMDDRIGNLNVIIPLIGVLSAIIDNVPLVAASMGMYDLISYPPDSYLWEFLAYCTGTGGSILIIGSAAGVVAMGMEKISFMWYLKRISLLAFAGYIAGAAYYMASAYFFQA